MIKTSHRIIFIFKIKKLLPLFLTNLVIKLKNTEKVKKKVKIWKK